MSRPRYVDRLGTVEDMAARVGLALDEPGGCAKSWATLKRDLRHEFAVAIDDAYKQSMSDRSGASLIQDAIGKLVEDGLRARVIRRIESRIAAAVESAPERGKSLSKVREDIRRENALPFEVLAEAGLCRPNGDELINDALEGMTPLVRIEVREDLIPGRAIQRVTRVRDAPEPEPDEPEEEPAEEESIGDRVAGFVKWILSKEGVVVISKGAFSLLVIAVTLLGVTFFDIVPVPCRTWPFSLMDKCS